MAKVGYPIPRMVWAEQRIVVEIYLSKNRFVTAPRMGWAEVLIMQRLLIKPTDIEPIMDISLVTTGFSTIPL